VRWIRRERGLSRTLLRDPDDVAEWGGTLKKSGRVGRERRGSYTGTTGCEGENRGTDRVNEGLGEG